jgi:thiol-disulfide isomerase/thioredoxin
MRRFSGLLLLVFTLMSYSAGILAQGIEFEHDKTFAELLVRAKKEDKIIFMDCYTTWCGPCKRLSADVFPQAEVGAYFNPNFINYKMDMEKGEGPEIAAEFGVRAYPTMLFIDGNKKVVNRVVGLVDPATLIAGGKTARNQLPGMLKSMKEKYKAGNREPAFLLEYLNALNDDGVQDDSLFKEYLTGATAEDLKQEKNNKTIFNITNSITSPGLAYILKNKDAYMKLMGDKAVDTKINGIAEKASNEALKKNNKELFEAAVRLLQTNKTPASEEKVVKLSMDYASRKNDWVAYDKYASDYIKKFGETNAEILNDVSWNYYLNVADQKLLTKASKWAYKAVNLKNNTTNNVTYAYLLYKLGNTKEAIKACDYAIIRAKEERIPATSALELKKVLGVK